MNQRYIEDKEKVVKGDAHMQKAGDHLADLFGKLSTVFSQSEEEAICVFDSDWLTEEGMDALDALAPVVETESEPDDFEAFVNAVFDGIEAEQHVEEEDTESDTDVDEVNEPPLISLNQAREKMRELMMFFESRVDISQNREHWVEQLAMLGKVQDQLTMYKEPLPEAQSNITKS